VTRGHDKIPQKDTTVKKFKADIFKTEQKDWVAYGYPNRLRGTARDDYVGNPFGSTARKDFIKTITYSCIDSTKETIMTPPYGITYDSVTTDVGPIETAGMRKVDARHCNGYLLIPGLIYHMSLKIKNIRINELYGNVPEVGMINFISQ
jgi:hypothetical protein